VEAPRAPTKKNNNRSTHGTRIEASRLARDAALQALAAGLSTIPPRADGSKAPYPASWRRFQKKLPRRVEIESWYRSRLTGVGLVTGKVSGCLECMDFDSHQAWVDYQGAAKASGLGELLEKVCEGYRERTPHGVHLLY
jgi:hypothetical protein